uniref:UBX domain-containing protein n=1 Tax=Panagrellus redivivus TaxID=6233 RepID=A0A7E4V593_PANRE
MNVELTGEQQNLIEQFKDITNTDDRPLAHAMLASVNWDLAQAVELQLNQAADNGGFDPDAENQANARIQRSVNQNAASSSRRSSSDDEPMMPVARPTGSAYRMNVRDLPPVARREYIGREPPRNESGSSSSSLAHSSTASSNHANSAANAAPPAAVVLSSDDEDDDDDDVEYEYDDHMEDDDHDRDSGFVVDVNNDRLPLVPSEYSTLDEALQNFVAVFESRYGGNHPYFCMQPLQAAAAQAFEAPGQDIAARKPLVIYLHNDHSVAANIFATQIMCSASIAPLLKNQFVTWGWDITYSENKARIVNWLEMMNIHDAQQIVQHSGREKYPLMLVLQKDRSVTSVITVISGHDDPDSVMTKLLGALDTYQQIKSRLSAEERARAEREQFRQEQAAEYEASKAQDRAKQEERERVAREEREAEEARVRAEEEAKALQEELKTTLPAEPAASDANAITIRLRYPDSKQVIRRFYMDEPLKYLVHFAGSQGYHNDKYKIFTSDFPRKDVATLDQSKTFRELKWSPREQVIVEEI